MTSLMFMNCSTHSIGVQAIAANMTDSEIQGLKELFLGFDKDRSGFITLQELQDGLDSLSLKSSSGKVRACRTSSWGCVMYECDRENEPLLCVIG